MPSDEQLIAEWQRARGKPGAAPLPDDIDAGHLAAALRDRHALRENPPPLVHCDRCSLAAGMRIRARGMHDERN